MNRRVITSVLTIAGLVAGVSTSSRAEAKWSRHHATGCTTWSGYDVTNSGTIYNNTNADIDLWCDLYDANDYAKWEISGINIHVYDGPGNAPVYAKACTTYWNVLGGSCGNWASTPFNATGNYTLQPTLGAIGGYGNGHFAYLVVQLPNAAQLKGFFTHD